MRFFVVLLLLVSCAHLDRTHPYAVRESPVDGVCTVDLSGLSLWSSRPNGPTSRASLTLAARGDDVLVFFSRSSALPAYDRDVDWLCGSVSGLASVHRSWRGRYGVEESASWTLRLADAERGCVVGGEEWTVRSSDLLRAKQWAATARAGGTCDELRTRLNADARLAL